MPNNHTAPGPRRFQVRAEQMLTWLATAVDPAGLSFQQTYGFDNTFGPDGDDLHDRIQILVSQAQTDGVLTLPDHHLELWQVSDEGFLLTLDPPHGPRLCSQHLIVGDLLPDKTAGSVAAFAVLDATARVANGLLDEQHHALARARAPAVRRIPEPGVMRAPLGPPPDPPATNPNGAGRPRRR
jgi:hypothetical protein